MKMFVCLVFVLLSASRLVADQQQEKMPKEDVIEVPAIGEGLCVSNVFQSNMVLQREKPIRVWGWAEQGENIMVAFAGQEKKATADKTRAWSVIFDAMPANTTPQTMTVRGKSKALSLENILLGDVWILGGQSNMEAGLRTVDNGDLEVASARSSQIRLLSMPHGRDFDSVNSFERLFEWSSWSSRHFRKGDWDVCTPELAREFTAIGYIFGRRLHMATQIPIGLIDTSRGGTTVEAWTPEDVMRSIEGKEAREKFAEWQEKIADYDPKLDLEQQIENYERRKKSMAEKGTPLPADSKPPSELRPGPKASQHRPGYCYATMLEPLSGLGVKGVLFHQGFNNAFDGSAGARMYYQVFGKMITAWRETFDDPELPFAIISLCTAGEPQTRENFLKPMYDAGVYLREAQYQTFVDFQQAGDTNIGFVSSFDLRKSFYHPSIKIPAGERAAKWALVSQYEILEGSNAHEYWMPPSIEAMKIVDSTIQLTMSTSIKTKDDSDGKMIGFAIAGEDGRFFPADIDWLIEGRDERRNRPIQNKKVLVLSNQFVQKPLHYRHAWARNPMSNLVNSRNIPLATQRSDDWILEASPIEFPRPHGMDDKSFRRYVRGRIVKELELDDLSRRIKEAEATVATLKPTYEQEKSAWEAKKASEAKRIEESKSNTDTPK